MTTVTTKFKSPQPGLEKDADLISNIDVNVRDPFWSQDITILYHPQRLIEFFPTKDMSPSEKLNAIARLAIYVSLLLLIYKGRIWPLYIGLVGLGVTLFLFKTSKYQKDNPNGMPDEGLGRNPNNNTFMSSLIGDTEFLTKAELNKIEDPAYKNDGQCTAPTRNNPFMNITVNEYLDNPTRPEACEYQKVGAELETHFNHNLYKDINDIFNKNNSQRMYYTTPITTNPNNQGDFAKWLYGVPATCKEDQENCLRYEDPRFNRHPVGDFENNPINLFEDKRVV